MTESVQNICTQRVFGMIPRKLRETDKILSPSHYQLRRLASGSLGITQVGRFGRGVSFLSFIQIQHDILS